MIKNQLTVLPTQLVNASLLSNIHVNLKGTSAVSTSRLTHAYKTSLVVCQHGVVNTECTLTRAAGVMHTSFHCFSIDLAFCVYFCAADPYTRLEKTSFRAYVSDCCINPALYKSWHRPSHKGLEVARRRWYFRVTGGKGRKVRVTILNVNTSYVYIPDIEGGGAFQKLYKAK